MSPSVKEKWETVVKPKLKEMKKVSHGPKP
jgi:hypothetical protein